jgi:hypothetical protein
VYQQKRLWSGVKKKYGTTGKGGDYYTTEEPWFIILLSIIIMLYHPCVTQTGTKKKKDLHCKSTGTQKLIKRKGKGILGKVRI